MLKRDKLDFERGTAAKTEGEDRNNAKENCHHDRYGTAGSLKSPASLGPVDILSKDNGHLMSQGNKLKFQRGAAANTEFEDRNKGTENRHHDRDGMAGPRKSPVFLSLVEI